MIRIPIDALPTLNKHDKANRGNRYQGAKMKKKATRHCFLFIKKAMNQGFKISSQPADLRFTWYAKDKRTDKDNIAFMVKYIFDGMVDAGLIKNDGWKEIGDWEYKFKVDKKDPRVEIEEI